MTQNIAHKIDFFDEKFAEKTSESKFGLCDDGGSKMAYLDFEDSQKWQGVVENENKLLVSFHPVDNCVKLKKDDGKDDEKCDGILRYSTTEGEKEQKCIVFVELKDCKTSGYWCQTAQKQIETTMKHFKNLHGLSNSYKIFAWIANKQQKGSRSTGQASDTFRKVISDKFDITLTPKIEKTFKI